MTWLEALTAQHHLYRPLQGDLSRGNHTPNMFLLQVLSGWIVRDIGIERLHIRKTWQEYNCKLQSIRQGLVHPADLRRHGAINGPVTNLNNEPTHDIRVDLLSE